jgi:hypothetical protein
LIKQQNIEEIKVKLEEHAAIAETQKALALQRLQLQNDSLLLGKMTEKAEVKIVPNLIDRKFVY